MIKISSRENSGIKLLAKLLSSGSERRQSGLFVLEGTRLIADAVKNNVKIKGIYFTEEGAKRAGELYETLSNAADECFWVEDFLLQRIADTKTPQGIVALCEGTISKEELPLDMSCGSLLLCSLQDPGNVGTILRSADAFGLSSVILAGDCPDISSPKVLRASMGAAFRVPITEISSPQEAVQRLKLRGVPVYAAALSKDSLAIDSIKLNGACIAIGNEGAGLPPEVISACDKTVMIPIANRCESLNAAMAACVFSWELNKAVSGK